MNNSKKPGIVEGYHYLWNMTKAQWKKHGGKVCTIAGTSGLILAGANACRKTYKIHGELEENGRRISEARLARQGDRKGSATLRVVKESARCGVKTSRHYIASAVAAGLSAYAVSKGWQKEHRNYQQAVAMVGVVMADFMNYRRNVISEHGEESDRRYMTTKRRPYIDVTKENGVQEKVAEAGSNDDHIVQLNENSLRILYSRETTPEIWHDSYVLRMHRLEDIAKKLEWDLIYGGSYTVNDVRRYFYGRKGDVPEGGMFGRIWDPGDPEHPERGAMVNLHYQDDLDFMDGITDHCWIIIDIDSEPLFELMSRKKEREFKASL